MTLAVILTNFSRDAVKVQSLIFLGNTNSNNYSFSFFLHTISVVFLSIRHDGVTEIGINV